MEQLVLSRVDAAPLSASGTMNFQIEVEFVPPCDLDRFCQDRQKIANFRMLQDNPRTDCIDDYCIDVATIENPTVLEVSPTEGPRSGGTLITTIINNLPAFSASDVSIKVRGSDAIHSALVVSLTQSSQSTMKSGLATLTFRTPKFMSDDEFASIELQVVLGGAKRSASFNYEYMPDVSGRAHLIEAFPLQVYREEDFYLIATLGNVARLNFPYLSSDIVAKVSGRDVDIENILVLSSSRETTVVQIFCP